MAIGLENILTISVADYSALGHRLQDYVPMGVQIAGYNAVIPDAALEDIHALFASKVAGNAEVVVGYRVSLSVARSPQADGVICTYSAQGTALIPKDKLVADTTTQQPASANPAVSEQGHRTS